MVGVAASIVAVRGSLLPAAVSTTTARGVPASQAGHRKLTRAGELNSTGTAWPFTVTRVPGNSRGLPEGSAREDPGAANHLPVRLVTDPGLQARGAELSTGRPERPSIRTRAVPDWWAELVATKATWWRPAWEGVGVQS